MAKPKIIDQRRDLFIEKIWRAYQTHKSCRKVAEIYGMSYQTVRRYLKEAGYELQKPGGYHLKGKKVPPFHYGCLAKWLRANPGVKLPRSPSAIADLTGCSLDSVKSYIYRRRKHEEAQSSIMARLRKEL